MSQPLTPQAAELIELAVWEDLFSAARAASRVGVLVERQRDVLLTSVPGIDVMAFNRALGVGALDPPRKDFAERIIEWYRAAGAPRFMVPIGPAARQAEIARSLEAAGFILHNRWVKLARSAAFPESVDTALRIERLTAGHGREFAELVARVFEWPEAIRSIFSPTVGRPGWWHYGAWDGPRLVAAGGLFVRDGVGWLGPAATLPHARGRGAQSALIARRIETGLAEGCHAFVVETAEETPERPVPSTRNLLRHGFEIIYLRPNYRLTF